jgi:Domain of unknown function (DUF5753)/Helix-turn-helix domain
MGNRCATAAYRELGGMLRQVRERAGLSAVELASRLGWSTTTISRMETGRRPSTTTDVIQYVVMCGMRMHETRSLVAFTRMAELKQGYHLSDNRIDGTLQSLIFHESLAEHSVVYEPLAIHGLLQTPEYARAHIEAVNPDIAEDRVAAAVRTRMERRQVMHLPNPARFVFYIHEQALRLKVGTRNTMHEQLLHLVLTAALDNVVLRIVPSAAGALGDGFRLMEFHDHTPIVYLDNLVFGGLVLEDPDYVNSYYKKVPILDGLALDEGESRAFAAELADAYDRGSQRGVPALLAKEQLQQCRGNRLRGSGVAEEQPQPRRGNRLRGGGVVEPPTPIYE